MLIEAAAYEQDDDAAPNPEASSTDRTLTRPRCSAIRAFDTNAWIAPDTANPSTSPHPTFHAIPAT